MPLAAISICASALGSAIYCLKATPLPAMPAMLATPEPAATPGFGSRFLLSGTATITHLEGPEIPGKVLGVTHRKTADAASAIMGNEPSTAGILETDAGGKAYLFFNSPENWSLSVAPNGAGATSLVGQTDGKGGFMFAGKHVLSNTFFFLTGKVTYQKGTLTPLKITGKFTAVSDLTEHYASGTFTAVPNP